MFCGGDNVPGGSNGGNNRINGSGTGIMDSNKKVLVGIAKVAVITEYINIIKVSSSSEKS